VRTSLDGVEVRAPGMLASHYAPRAGLLLVDRGTIANEAARRAAEGMRVAALVPPSIALPAAVHRHEVPEDAEGLARELYGALRHLDAAGFDVVVAALPEEHGLGLAVRDRLMRAAAPRSRAQSVD
jgi:L-threonylcarbamoyladenylate synthase